MGTLLSTYYDQLIAHESTSFDKLVQTNGWIEDGFKTRKLKDYHILFEQSLSGTGGSPKKNFSNRKNDKTEEDVHTISASASRYQQSYAPPTRFIS